MSSLIQSKNTDLSTDYPSNIFSFLSTKDNALQTLDYLENSYETFQNNFLPSQRNFFCGAYYNVDQINTSNLSSAFNSLRYSFDNISVDILEE